MRTGNLLDAHPDGLGKHICIHAGMRWDFTEKEILECIENYGFPFFIESSKGTFLVKVGSDLTIDPPDFYSSASVVGKYNDVSHWLKEAYTHVGIPPDHETKFILFEGGE